MNKKYSSGVLLISLDFELLWGVLDSRGSEYFPNIKAVHDVLPKMLDLFEKYEVKVTWATVGALFCKNFEDFRSIKPSIQPSYINSEFNPYNKEGFLEQLDNDLLFAPCLVEQIKQSKHQELASHTFSHYYALEAGQSLEQFDADLKASVSLAKTNGLVLNSLVFPRNQFNEDYLDVCKTNGFIAYRGNPQNWAYRAETYQGRNIFKRIFRLIDSYMPLSGSLSQVAEVNEAGLVNLPASLFFRPYSKKLRLLEKIKILRYKFSMTQAAKNNKIFHLWWHPHNFSCNTEENLGQIELLLKHQKYLEKKYKFRSVSMVDYAKEVLTSEK